MNQREVKFRAFIKKEKIMVNVKRLAIDNKHIIVKCFDKNCKADHNICDIRIIPYKNIELMQFTGLKDKNGKEIYERDIVKQKNGRKEIQIGEIKWVIRGYEVLTNISWKSIKDEIEVIGNIYENPNLLTPNTKEEE